jgi:hypothetical protein
MYSLGFSTESEEVMNLTPMPVPNPYRCKAGKIYVGQTELAVDISIVDNCGTSIALVAEDTLVFKLKRPDGETREYTPELLDGAQGKIRWSPGSATTLSEPGEYTFWVKAEFDANNRVLFTEPYNLQVHAEGT